MPIWLCRAGSNGEYENKFLEENRIYLTWEDLDVNLKEYDTREKLIEILTKNYPNQNKKAISNWTSQIYPFAHEFQVDDWIVLPSKQKPVINIGRVKSNYSYNKNNGKPYYHYRDIEWFAKDIPRSNFDQDILYTFGAFLTICRIKRNDAENRIHEMSKNQWIVPNNKGKALTIDDSENSIDIEQITYDEIAKSIYAKYKGHGLTKLIDAILKTQGYTTYRSPEGPDKGVDILAATGGLGFGHPRICVQVKSQQEPIERVVLDQLIGVMQNFQAEQGLLVSWGGFKSSIERELAAQFFRVRLWSQNDIIREFLNVYEKIDEEIKADIPLKRIWVLANKDEDI